MRKWLIQTFVWNSYEKRRTRDRVRLLKLRLWCQWAKDLNQLRYVRDCVVKENYKDPVYSELARALNNRQSQLYGLMFPLLRPTNGKVEHEIVLDVLIKSRFP